MSKSHALSPARSVGEQRTSQRYKTRSSQSFTTSPARTSRRLTAIVDEHIQKNRESFPLTPLSKTVLNDDTNIEQPRRSSWWKKVDNSRDVIEVLDNNKPEVVNDVLEEFDVEVLSQSQKNDHTVDLPDSSDNETINSIIVPQRKLFTQKENVPQKKYEQVTETRETLAKHNKPTDIILNDRRAGTKTLFGQGSKRNKPIFPAALLNISPDKTIGNKTKELVAEVKAQPRSLFGNRPGTKKKNVFADFIVSESEEEIPDIEPRRFTFSKRPEPIRRVSTASRGTREPSPTMSINTDIEMDDWKMLPSSTMVEHQLEAIVGVTPGKKARLSKLSEAKESEAGTGITGNTDIRSEKSRTLIKSNTEIEEQEANVKDLEVEGEDKQAASESEAENDEQQEVNIEMDREEEIDTGDDEDQRNINDEDIKNGVSVEGNLEQYRNESDQESNDGEGGNQDYEEIQVEEIDEMEQEKSEEELNDESVEDTPGKKARLSKLSEAKESEAGTGITGNTDIRSEKSRTLLKSNTEIEEQEANVKEQEVEGEDEQAASESEAENDEQQVVNIEMDREEEIDTGDDEDQRNINDENTKNGVSVEENLEQYRNESDQESNDGEDGNQDYEEIQVEEIDEMEQEKSEEELNDESVEDTPGKKARLSKLSEAKESEAGTGITGNTDIRSEKSRTLIKSNTEIEEQEANVKDQEVEGEDEQAASESEAENDEQQKVNIEMDREEEIDTGDDEDQRNINDEDTKNGVSVEENFEQYRNESDQESNDGEDDSQDYEEIQVEEIDEMEQEESEEELNDESVEDDDDQESDEDEENQKSEVVNETGSHDEIENTNESQKSVHENNKLPNESLHISHDTTGRHRNKNKSKSPEAILHDMSNQEDSFIVKGRNTSIRKKSILKNFSIRPSMAPPRESTGLSDGTTNSSAEGSGWDSHRTTRKTLRQTFGRDFTPRKSLRALVMEKSAKRQTQINSANAELRRPQANSLELQENMPLDSEIEFEDNVDMTESDHEISKRTRQTTLEMYLQKIKNNNMERNKKIEEQVRNSFKPTASRSDFLNRAPYNPLKRRANTKSLQKPVAKKRPVASIFPLDDLPPELKDDMKYKPPKRFRPSNAPWITKRLYKFLETKLEPKYDYKARLRAEKLVETIYHFAKDTRRYRTAQPPSVIELKKEMARLNIVKTHYDFYNFFHDYMPVEVKVKVVPDIVNEIPLPREGLFSNIVTGE